MVFRCALPRLTTTMPYLWTFACGIGGAVLAASLWVAWTLVLPVEVPYIIGRLRGTGGDGTGFVSSGSIFVAAALGFLAAVAWRVWRLRTTG